MKRKMTYPAIGLALALAAGACGGEGGEPEVQVPPKAVQVPPQGNAPPAVGAAAGVALSAEDLPAGVTVAMVEEGQTLYATLCTACHGPAGAGTPLGPALDDPEWINITGEYDDILNVIHAGVPEPKQFPGMMAPKGGGSFTDEQVRSLAAYVYALSRG